MSPLATPSFRLDERVVVITGAGGGIGRACAIAAAGAGADVAVCDRNEAAADEVVDEIEAAGRKALRCTVDVTDAASVAATVTEVEARFGRIDVLVNNVGISRQGPAETVSEEDFDAIVATNLKGTFLVTRAVACGMLERRSGRIVNIASQAGIVTLAGEAIYCMTKAAIIHLTRCLAAEWGPRGVAVNSVAPTFVRTDSTRAFLAVPENYARTVGHIPLGRVGEVDDVTGAVIFLASAAGSLANGSNLVIDGGWSVA